MARSESRLFPAALKYWRNCRGMTQLDLALSADVSSRHVSFLETGRAQPSREMVLRLAAVLGVPLRDQNILLKAAGFDPAFEESGFERGLSKGVQQAISRISAQQEPFPLLILNRTYDILQMNQGAQRLLPRVVAEPAAVGKPANLLRLLFDQRLARPFIVDWEAVARTMLSRLYREALARPSDETLMMFVRDLLAYPDVPDTLKQPELAGPCDATCPLRMRHGDLEVGFLTTMTVFSAPQDVTVDEIRIESYFPQDERTAETCARWSTTRRS